MESFLLSYLKTCVPSFVCFLLSMLLHLYFLSYAAWSLLVMVTFLHCSPCVITSFYFFGLYSIVIFLHTYLYATFILPWIFQVMSCGEIPSFFTVTDSMWLIHYCWIKDNFYIFISLLRGTFFISVETYLCFSTNCAQTECSSPCTNAVDIKIKCIFHKVTKLSAGICHNLFKL